MSSHGHSFADFADMYSRIQLADAKYLGFRDVPDLLRKYVKGDVALDYGCGHGISTAFLQKLGFSVDGVDINEYILNVARRELPQTNFQLVRDDRIPAEDEHYDLVFCSLVLHDIGSKGKLVATLTEITRVLKADATFIAIEPSEAMYGRDWTCVDAQFEENENLKSGDRAKLRFKENNCIFYNFFWTEEDYGEVLADAGLDVVLVHRPLGRDDEGFAWINEKEIAPFVVYVAQKKKGLSKVDTEFKNSPG